MSLFYYLLPAALRTAQRAGI